MRKKLMLGLAAALILLAAPAWAGEYYTKTDTIACTSKKSFDQVYTYIVQKDMAAFRQMLDGRRCVVLKPYTKVFLQETHVWSGSAEVRLPGTTFNLWVSYDKIKK